MLQVINSKIRNANANKFTHERELNQIKNLAKDTKLAPVVRKGNELRMKEIQDLQSKAKQELHKLTQEKNDLKSKRLSKDKLTSIKVKMIDIRDKLAKMKSSPFIELKLLKELQQSQNNLNKKKNFTQRASRYKTRN